ncbi:hypothetical protein BX600DRAFT_550589 [Xylariales sp. PMI_506]|nr:hypothetical protein BX600DRAFT_550589 [Xylariales sp. PMI_506]
MLATKNREDVPSPGAKSFQYEWARYVARRSLDDDLANLKELIQSTKAKENVNIPGLDFGPDAPIRDIVQKTQQLTGLGFLPPAPEKFKVAIVGAGVAGLFTAMLLDWLNKQPQCTYSDGVQGGSS